MEYYRTYITVTANGFNTTVSSDGSLSFSSVTANSSSSGYAETVYFTYGYSQGNNPSLYPQITATNSSGSESKKFYN